MRNLSKSLKNNQLPFFSAVIFDLDGLVLDTEATFIHAWQQAAEQMGFCFSMKFCQSLIGLDGKTIVKKLQQYCREELDLNAFQQLSRQYWRKHVTEQGIPQKKGALELLSFLKQQQIPFCLATNSLEKNARECLELAGLVNVFEKIISSEHVKQPKPKPDIFLHAAQRLNHSISNCLVLEDSLTGIQAAHSAGAKAVLVPSIFPVSEELQDLSHAIFKDLNEVVEIMRFNLP